MAEGAFGGRTYSRYAESLAQVDANVRDLFHYLDDHRRLSSHMSESSWRMGGGSMSVDMDQGLGQRLGSRIRLHGRVLGMILFVETHVTDRVPPRLKSWETIGEPRLLVIGAYRMTFEVTPRSPGSMLKVSIEYELPKSQPARLLGHLFGAWYARWCTRRMVRDAQQHYRGGRAAAIRGT
jgi:hypothetical protein